MSRFLIETLLSGFGLLVSFGLPWLIWRWLRARRPASGAATMTGDGDGGRIVPLVAAFGGVRGLPWIGYASNNLNPRLVIAPAGITYRLLGSRARSYAEIEQVDVRIFGATVNLSFAFRDTFLTFDANVGDTMLAAQVLALLAGKVSLTDRAATLAAEA